MGDSSVVLEGVIEVCPHPCLYQPIVDLLLGVIPSGPVSAQLAVSLFQVLFIKGCLSQAVNVGLDANVVEVPQFCVDEGM